MTNNESSSDSQILKQKKYPRNRWISGFVDSVATNEFIGIQFTNDKQYHCH